MNKPDFGLQRYSHRASCMDIDVITEEDDDGNWYDADSVDPLLESNEKRIRELEDGLREADRIAGLVALALTKREWLAGLVFQQFLAGSVLPRGFDATEALALTALRATEAADHLLDALSKTGGAE